jgi:hypothetical protein
MYWRLSFYELVGRVKLKFGQLHAQTACYYQGFALVVSQALGGNRKPGETPKLVEGEYTDLGQAPSFEAAIAQINSALTFG